MVLPLCFVLWSLVSFTGISAGVSPEGNKRAETGSGPVKLKFSCRSAGGLEPETPAGGWQVVRIPRHQPSCHRDEREAGAGLHQLELDITLGLLSLQVHWGLGQLPPHSGPLGGGQAGHQEHGAEALGGGVLSLCQGEPGSSVPELTLCLWRLTSL